MARVEASAVIRAPLDRVYALAKDVERFPQFMPDLESVAVLERRPGGTVTQWVGVVQGRKIRWVEEDEWDDARHVCVFRQRSGDFNRYEGTWTFEAVPDGTQSRLAVDFELDIPLAGALLSNLVKVLMRKNCENMLASLKGQLETPAS
ncbi:MAG: SRPBCC family protein [Armatimonadetes bacterium]|nr:SRPBCC family protein [Armatimonadota bacterium]